MFGKVIYHLKERISIKKVIFLTREALNNLLLISIG
jgi:hypothetical protein